VGLIRHAERRGAQWQVHFTDGTVAVTRWIVDATGRRSALARRLGAKKMRDEPLIALYAMGASPESFRLNRTIVEAVPQGWWYGARLPSGAALAGLHTSRDFARGLRGDPARWLGALAETRHLSFLLRDIRFERFLRPLDACGATLDRYSGEGWIACGDAALSFDPVSGQGIFSALNSGKTAAHAVEDALNGSAARLDAYAAMLGEVRRIYRARVQAVYRSAFHFSDQPFRSARATPALSSGIHPVVTAHEGWSNRRMRDRIE
jgi:flavin-dependent dehydrogenase